MPIHSANELATLFFGHRSDYVITLNRANLDQLIRLGSAAREEFRARPAE